MKTIGVLGGLGPQATMDFEARVHTVSQQLLPQAGNRGYPPMVVYYHRDSPILMANERTPMMPMQVDPQLLEAARRLGEWADFLVITSNGVHHWQHEIEAAADRPVLSMIDVTLDEVTRRQWQTVGVMTFIEPSIYQVPLTQRGFGCEVVPEDLQHELDRVIPAYMAGQSGPTATATVRDAVDALRGRSVDGVILGCTELPLLLGDATDAPDILNPSHLLAEAAVRYALS